MELNSRDFSLNFRGFEHQDAERIERFRAFCEANFGLPPEDSRNLATPNHTFVLTHSSSPQELEALAQVLREIGARVEVAEETSAASEQTILPSTQELHRLFGPQSEEAALREGRACKFSPVGSSLYLLNPSASTQPEAEIIQRRALRRASREASSFRPVATAAILGGGLLLFVSLTSVVFYMVLRGDPSLTLPQKGRALVVTSASNIPSLPIQTEPSRSVSGRTNENGFAIELKGLLGGSAVSVSSFKAHKEGTPTGIRRLEAEPVFLNQSMPGVWEGSMPMYATVESQGIEQQQRLQSAITIRIGENGRTAVATVTFAPETVGPAIPLPFSSLTVRLAD